MKQSLAAIPAHPSAEAAQLRASLLAALRARRVPGRLLYASPAQARRWLAYHDAYSPSRGDAAVAAAYDAAFRAAAAALSGAALSGAAAPAAAPSPGALSAGALSAGAACVVGIGCGGGRKDAELLAALRGAAAAGAPIVAPADPPAYAPLDGSAALVAEAAGHVRERWPEAALHPLVADLAALPDLGGWLAALPAGPRVLTALGMLPNLDHRTFPRWLAALLRTDDRLVVSANLAPGGRRADAPRILAQYDNPPARAWYEGALAELGLAPDVYTLAVSDAPLDATEARDDAWRVQVTATLQRDATLAVVGGPIAWHAGEPVDVFASRRFTAAAAEALLVGAGMRISGRWEGAGGEEGVFLCGRG